MRLFVSVEPSASALAALAGAVRALDLAPARVVPPERWHVTLAFLGEVGDGRLPRLHRALAEVAATAEPLRLAITGAGTFPSRGHPSVLWMGLDGEVERLQRLARDVGRAAGDAGVAPPGRRFSPHLTLARYRRAPAGAAVDALAALGRHAGPRFTVDRIQLVRSHLGPHPRHEALAGWALSAGA